MRARPTETAVRRLPRRGLHAFVALFALAVFCLAPAPLRAAPQTYTGEAPVDSQSEDDRLEALKIALANVIIDQTGDAGVLSRSDVAAQLAKASRYVLQFRYKQNPGAADTGAPKLTLVAEFDKTYPDIEVEIDHTTGDHFQKVQLGVASNTPPDVYFDASLRTGGLGWHKGIIEDLEPYLKTDFKQDEHIKEMWIAMVYDGRRIAVPFDSGAVALVFNIDLFNQAGVPLPEEFDRFQEWHKAKLAIRPGITCYWQINGRSEISDFDQWARLDLDYIEGWSLWTDVKILLRTLPAVLAQKNAY